MSFWEKLKNWRNYLIGWLGGYSAEEVKMMKHMCRAEEEKMIAENSASEREEIRMMWERENEKLAAENAKLAKERNDLLREARRCMEGLRTAHAEIAYPAGMAYDDIKRIARESIVRQLGEAVYPYAKHFVTSDGRYIVAVTVATEDGHGGK